MNDFTEKFITKTNAELLKIINSPGEYKADALEAAKDILESRKLSPEEVENAKTELAEEWKEKEIEEQKKKDVEEKIKETGRSWLDIINPLKAGITSTERSIRTITIVFSLLLLYKIGREYRLVLIVICGGIAKLSIDEYVYRLFEPVIVLSGIILFYKRKKAGWVILVVLLLLYATLSIYRIIFIPELYFPFFIKEPSENSFSNYTLRFWPSNIAWLIFDGGLLLLLSKKSVREVYQVSRNTIYRIVALIGGLALLFWRYMRL